MYCSPFDKIQTLTYFERLLHSIQYQFETSGSIELLQVKYYLLF